MPQVYYPLFSLDFWDIINLHNKFSKNTSTVNQGETRKERLGNDISVSFGNVFVGLLVRILFLHPSRLMSAASFALQQCQDLALDFSKQ